MFALKIGNPVTGNLSRNSSGLSLIHLSVWTVGWKKDLCPANIPGFFHVFPSKLLKCVCMCVCVSWIMFPSFPIKNAGNCGTSQKCSHVFPSKNPEICRMFQKKSWVHSTSPFIHKFHHSFTLKTAGNLWHRNPGVGSSARRCWAKSYRVWPPRRAAAPLYGKPSGRWRKWIWLVVWNMTFIFHNIWDNPSHWLIFLRGVGIPPTRDRFTDIVSGNMEI